MSGYLKNGERKLAEDKHDTRNVTMIVTHSGVGKVMRLSNEVCVFLAVDPEGAHSNSN